MIEPIIIFLRKGSLKILLANKAVKIGVMVEQLKLKATPLVVKILPMVAPEAAPVTEFIGEFLKKSMISIFSSSGKSLN